ncbi:MAG: hypothetical protein JO247_02975 [Chloroflexi bacterium]|nr:hypothetical protein [Chloroflexota bacterium]
MNPNALPYVAVLMAGAAVGGVLTWGIWPRRDSPGGLAFVVVAASAAWWCLWDGLDVALPDLQPKILTAQLWYISAGVLPAALLVFALQYSHRERWSWPRFAPFAVLPLGLCITVWTNPLHHLFWSRTYLRTDGPFQMFGVFHGPLFWFWLGCEYIQLAIASVVLLRTITGQRGLYRRQVVLLALGIAVPWAANSLYAAGFSPFPDLDLTPLSFVAGAGLLAAAIFRYALLDVVPVAHHAVIDGLAEPVFVLDRQQRLVYFNQAGQAFAGWTGVSMLGAAASEALGDVARAAEAGGGELQRGVGSARQTYDASVSRLGREGATAVLLRDVTDRGLVDNLQRSRRQVIAAEEEVRKQIAELLHGPIQTRLLAAWYELGRVLEDEGAVSREARQRLEDIRHALDELREQDVRYASHLLHPSIIRLGLAPALDYLASGYEHFFELDLEVEPDLRFSDPFDSELRLTAYRIVEEALGNAAKHAQASHVDISLGLEDGDLRVRVSDDGRGFDAVHVAPGLGFRGLGQRIQAAGGRWDVRSTPADGTHIDVRLPVATAAGAVPADVGMAALPG